MINDKTVRAGRIGVAAGLVAAVLAAGLAAPGVVAQVTKPLTIAAPAGAPLSFADLIERVSPAVVSVVVTTEIKVSQQERAFNPFRGLPGFDEYEDRFGKKGEGEGEGEEGGSPETDQEGRALGSGFFISQAGYIVTNNHVVENAREVTVTLKNGDELEAEIVGRDLQTDLAVLKVKKSGSYPYVEFATKAKPRVGDWVVAVGNPFGLGGTATAGIVSADGRELDGPYNDFIQVDAPINRGNSGGPTFNLNGQVIGVNTAIFSDSGGGSVGIGFAIEASAAKAVTDSLIKNGKIVRGWLGVEIQNLDPRFADAWGLKNVKGAVVSKVTKGGPAETSGIKREDIIIAVNGDKVENNRQLTQRVGGLIAGSRNSFKVIRKGKEETVWVVVRERGENIGALEPNANRDNFAAPKAATGDVKILGGTVRPLLATELSRYELTPGDSGLLVVTADRKGALEEAAIAAGDALLTANGKALKAVKDLEDVIAAAKADGKDDIVVLVGCGNRQACGDSTLLHPVKIK